MGDDDVARIAAVHHDAEMSCLGAQVLVAVAARRTFAAADPRIDRDLAPRRDVGLRTRCLDHAGDLMAESERQRAAGADVELPVGGELEEAVLDVQVGMADAAPLDAHQHFAARAAAGNRPRSRTGGHHSRRATGGAVWSCGRSFSGTILRRHRGCVERVGECDESFDRDFFGAHGAVDPGGGEERRRIDAEGPQALAQHLATLAEGGGGDALERRSRARQRRGPRDQAAPPTTSPWAAARRPTARHRT